MFVEHLHGGGTGSLKPQIYEATTELGDKITFRNQPRATGSPAGDPARDSAGELREAPRQHVQSDHLPRNKSQNAEFDGARYQEVDFAGH